ncbi:CP [Sida golden yellow spot virus]|uniref:CP n=1 Tax=Sida golden yellow spot virus TaxID=1949198 RepID=A0A1S6KEI6_9GEMI|nr:CP [Sida golden yellow spot virus]AQT01549.1 CP [Sida golden yellow spot virus]
MDFRRKRKASFTPLTPYQMAKRFRQIQQRSTARRRLNFGYPSPYASQVPVKSRGLTDRFRLTNACNCYGGPTYKNNQGQMILLPARGQGVDQRRGSTIKVWSINIKSVWSFTMPSSGSGGDLGNVFFRWVILVDRTPGKDVPSWSDVYQTPSIDSDTQTMINCHMKQDSLGRFQILSDVKRSMQPFQKDTHSRDHVLVDLDLRPRMRKMGQYSGSKNMRPILVDYHANNTSNAWTDIKKNGLFMLAMAHCDVDGSFVLGSCDVSVTGYS